MNITHLLEGENAYIDKCDNWRLLEHGFVNNTAINIYKKFQNITCIYIRGAVIACRDADLAKITVKDYNNI